MKRTTLYLEPELEVLVKLESLRRKQPMAEIIRAALRSYLAGKPGQEPPGAGAFASGRKGTAQKAEQVLARLRFGQDR